MAAAVLAAAPTPIPKLAFEKYTLANGLQVVLHVDRRLPIVHVNLWYHVGSKNERAGRTGFAHLFEHMMLQGSKNASTDYFTLMQRVGARAGRDSNGTTDQDRTNYFSTAPSGALEYMLWVHSDLLATLPDALTQQKLDNQREVVRNERRQGMENTPYNRVWALEPEALYGSGHPYSWPVLGFHEDLAAASLDDVKEFFRTYYTPNNLSLAITGDFDPAVARALVDRYFGSIPPGPPLSRPTRLPVRLVDRKELDFNDRVAQERLYLFWPIPALGEPGQHELELAASILGTGLSSRLQKALVLDEGLATEVEVGASTGELAGEFQVMATARAGARLDAIERVVMREIGRLAREGPTAAELERARAATLTAIVDGLQNIGGFGGRADLLNRYNVFYGDPARYQDDLEQYLRLAPLDIRAAVAARLDTPGRLVIRAHPETSSRPQAVEPDRSKPPALAADPPFRGPAVQAARLGNGLELIVIERHELPIVTTALVARAGSASDPQGKEGLAALTAAAMKRGAGGRSALALEEGFADLGVELKSDAQRERATLVISALPSKVAPALALLASVAREPGFPEAEVVRERSRLAAAIAQDEQDPAQIAARLRDVLAFGRQHPFGHPVQGYRSTVAALTRDDVVAFHRAHWAPRGSALVMVGDVTLDQAKAQAGTAFGTWSGAGAALPAWPAAVAPYPGRVAIVDRPDAAQTYVVQVLGAPGRRGADYYAWRLANEVLGSAAIGRLWTNLRQGKGYSYGVFSTQGLSSGPLSWFAYGGVQADKTKESVAEFAAEARGIGGDRPIAVQEMEDARQAVLRNYAAGFLTNFDVARRVADLWTRDWPLALLADEPALYATVTLAEVQAAARRYAVPADSTFLLVGDRAAIEAGVRSLGLGEVVLLDAEGKPAGR